MATPRRVSESSGLRPIALVAATIAVLYLAREVLVPLAIALALMAVWFLILFWLAASASLAAGPPRKQASFPHVFLVTIDTLRADHVRCYGDEHIQTPALDSLAKDGFRFQQAFTPSPITNTSHATILTGLLPSSHGVTDFAVARMR